MFEVTSNPVAAVAGQGVLIVGVEGAGDHVRVYLRDRGLGLFVQLSGPAMIELEAVWLATMGHLWLVPAPPDDALCVDAEATPV